MKISKNLSYILMGLSVLVLLLSYLFVFTKLQEKTDVLNNENVALQADVNVLLELQLKHEERQELKKQYELENQEILVHFPEEIKIEDIIMYVVNLEMTNQFKVVDLALPDFAKTDLTTYDANGNAISTEQVSTETVSGNSVGQYVLGYAESKSSFLSTYKSIKDVVKYILDDENQKSIQTLTVNYDEATGNVKGEIDYYSYYVNGSGKEYIPPTVSGVAAGTTNMFHSVEDLNAVRDAAETTEGTGTETGTETETETGTTTE